MCLGTEGSVQGLGSTDVTGPCDDHSLSVSVPTFRSSRETLPPCSCEVSKVNSPRFSYKTLSPFSPFCRKSDVFISPCGSLSERLPLVRRTPDRDRLVYFLLGKDSDNTVILPKSWVLTQRPVSSHRHYSGSGPGCDPSSHNSRRPVGEGSTGR